MQSFISVTPHYLTEEFTMKTRRLYIRSNVILLYFLVDCSPHLVHYSLRLLSLSPASDPDLCNNRYRYKKCRSTFRTGLSQTEHTDNARRKPTVHKDHSTAMTMQHFSILPAIAILYSILLLYYHPIFIYALSSNRRIRGETLHDIRWKRQFEAWKGFLSDSDNSSVRKVSRRGHPDLYKWVYRQKKCFRSGTLKGQRLQLLMESGFFDIEVDGDQEERSFDDNYGVKSWDEMFVKLIEYKENHTELEFLELWCNGDIILQNDHDCTDFVEWVEEQSKSYRKLSAARIDKLSATGIELNLTKARWQRMYLKLREFRNTQGHCNVSCDDDENLSIWVNSQRRLYRKRLRGDSKCLSDERFGLLKEIGIHHHHNENYMQWEDYYLQLFDIVEQNNDPDGIETYLRESKSNPKLLRWIYAQRGYYRKKCNGEDTPLTDDRLKRLIELDFNFDTRKSWDDRYDELCEYVAQNGHFNISRKDNYGLSQWVCNSH